MKNLQDYIDHTLLKNTAIKAGYDQLIEEGLRHKFYSLCIPPSWVDYVKNKIQDSSIKLTSVAGFPMGYSSLNTKLLEMEELFQKGCHEVDVVLNISEVKSQNWKHVEEEIKSFSQLSNQHVVKVIIESGIMGEGEVTKICEIFNTHPTTFVKTSTGFAEAGAEVRDVELMRSLLDSSIKIKASGGIRNYSQAVALIDAGASRLGTSQSPHIMEGQKDL